jgi:hypothetical protein
VSSGSQDNHLTQSPIIRVHLGGGASAAIQRLFHADSLFAGATRLAVVSVQCRSRLSPPSPDTVDSAHEIALYPRRVGRIMG